MATPAKLARHDDNRLDLCEQRYTSPCHHDFLESDFCPKKDSYVELTLPIAKLSVIDQNNHCNRSKSL
jgi:hypothetical protein